MKQLLIISFLLLSLTGIAQNLEHEFYPAGFYIHDVTTMDTLLTGDSIVTSKVKFNFQSGGLGKITINPVANPFINFTNEDGEKVITIDAKENLGSRIVLWDANDPSIQKIRLAANYNGGTDARIITDEIEINGGADLAEHFAITNHDAEIIPGLLVSLDPSDPGKLMISHEAYDTKIAGILSGANGVKPGILMGQTGTIADGDELVTLSGRTYVKANTSNGKIKVGDLITTSSVPGQAMKATKRRKSKGAVIGKAMTELENESGYILVLVNLQ